jgi:hypothetical protein
LTFPNALPPDDSAVLSAVALIMESSTALIDRSVDVVFALFK